MYAKKSMRKYSTDNSSDNDSDTGLNRAILMSESRNLLTEESIGTEQKFRSTCSFNTRSVKRTISSSNSSAVKFSLRCDKTIQSDKESRDDRSRVQNTETSPPVGSKFKVEVSVNPSESCRITSQDQSQNLLPESGKMEAKGPKPKIISDEILLDPITIQSKKDLNENLTTHDNIHEETELMKKHRHFIKRFDLYLSGTEDKKEDDLLSPGSDASTNTQHQPVEGFTVNNLEESNIWPALNALDTTYTNVDGNTSKDHTDIIENLSKQFSYSPRSFTEALLTIIEESFVESEEVSDGFLQFIKRSEGAEFLEGISSPQLLDSQTSGQLTDAVTKYDSYDSGFNSTKYKSFKKLMSPNVKAKTYRRSVRLDIGSNTPIKIQRSNEISPIKPFDEKKYYPSTPSLIKDRGTPKIAMAHRLEIGRARSIGKSPRRRRNFVKPPQIVVHPGTPQSQRKIRRFSIQGSDEEEYLTAESDCEEPEIVQSEDSTTIESEHPVASSSRKLNMSSVTYHHQEWVQAYEEISQYKSVTHRSTAAITETKETHTKKLDIERLRKLQQKRQQCLDLIDQLLEKGPKVDASVEEQTSSTFNSCKLTPEFFTTLRACSEYFTCGMNARNACRSTAISCRNVSSLSINIKKKKNLSPHLSVHRGRTKSPRRSLGKKLVRVKSPGAKCLNLHANSLLKPRSLKGSKSPAIDTSSLRPVSQLRSLFSPGTRAAGCSGSNANLPNTFLRPTAGFELQERGKTKQKYKHVVSPVRQYIKGNKAP